MVELERALECDAREIRKIVSETINKIYPHYYPAGAVDFFLALHSEESIRCDAAAGRVYFILENSERVGTVTLGEDEISRFFVLPERRGMGVGTQTLDIAEKMLFSRTDRIHLHASFAAKAMYVKRGYRESEYRTKEMENGDFLCVDIMEKEKA